MKHFKKLFYALLVIFFISCGSGKINMENYEKIYTGMSKSEVEAILGKGNSQVSSSYDGSAFGGSKINTEVITYQSSGSGLKIISITYMNDKVEAKVQTGL